MSTGDDPYSLGQPKSNGRPAAVLSRSRSSASPSPRISPSPSRSGSPSPRLSPRPSRSGSPSPRQSPRVQEQLLISKYERKMVRLCPSNATAVCADDARPKNRMAKNFHKLKEAGVSNDDAVAVMLRAKRFLGPTTSRGVRERDLINLVTAAKASSTKRVVKEGTDAKPVPKDPTTTAEKRLPSSDADNASLDWFHQARDSFANPPRSKGELITHFRQIPVCRNDALFIRAHSRLNMCRAEPQFSSAPRRSSIHGAATVTLLRRSSVVGIDANAKDANDVGPVDYYDESTADGIRHAKGIDVQFRFQH
ncbi:Uncharacterized protein PBTT_07811 [Plasmodiophora brassicae]